jgi:Icc-related predicted phosphoesterase
MKIGFASDLHLEFGACDLLGEAEVLILAGDIFVIDDIKMFPFNTSVFQPHSTKFGNSLGYYNFLKDISDRFPRTYIILGNHEHYGSKFNKSYQILKHNVESSFHNIWVLQNSNIKLNGTTSLLAATLWTNMDNIDYHIMEVNKHWMNEYKTVVFNSGDLYRKLKPKDTVNDHIHTLRYFEAQLKANPKHEFIIATHHAPSMKSIDHEKSKEETRFSYASNLEEFIAEHRNIQYWIHGHVHNKLEYMVDGCTILCNPRGYYGYDHCDLEHSIQVIEI